MIDCPNCYGFGLLIPWPNAPYRTCSTCHGSGQVRGLCLECGEPLRDCDIGDNCLECVEHCERYGSERFDTRPQDRAALARVRWEDLCGDVRWLCAELSRMLGTPRAEGLRRRLHLAVDAQERTWTWVLRWSLAAVRG